MPTDPLPPGWTSETPDIGQKCVRHIGNTRITVNRHHDGRWFMHSLSSGGEFIEADDPPLDLALDLAIERTRTWLAELLAAKEENNAEL